MRDKVVTLFGGTGFIGRQIVKRLAEEGAYIRVVTRERARAMPLKPLAEVGQLVPVPFSEKPDALRALVRGADSAIYLIGILHARDPHGFTRVHAELPAKIAAAAKAEGVRRFLHMSAIGADPNSPAAYGKSKALGEARVREAAPDAVIFRPSIVFGPGDGFFERFGRMATIAPALPLIDGGKTRFQPVYAGNVADAFIKAMRDDSCRGKLYELGGPKVYSFKELLLYLIETLNRRRFLMPLSSDVAGRMARFFEYLPEPPLTRDQLAMLQVDNVVSGRYPGLKDLGIASAPLEVIVPTYLKGYARMRPPVPTQ